MQRIYLASRKQGWWPARGQEAAGRKESAFWFLDAHCVSRGPRFLGELRGP